MGILGVKDPAGNKAKIPALEERVNSRWETTQSKCYKKGEKRHVDSKVVSDGEKGNRSKRGLN